ncbi:MAG: ABC transporter substrate-binding protein [bacterium]
MKRGLKVLLVCGLIVGFTTVIMGAKELKVFWHPAHAYDDYKQVFADFEKSHPDFQVKVEYYQWGDMRSKVLTIFMAGTPPDLIEEPGGWCQEFGMKGYLEPLNSRADKWGKLDDWFPYTVSRNTYEGKLYGIQLHLTCQGLFYNKGMLRDAGLAPPTTWDEFLEAAKKLTEGNVWGYAPNWEYSYWVPFVLQNGGKYYDPATNKVLLDRPEAVEALQFFTDLVHKYKVSPLPDPAAGYEGPRNYFVAKRAAIITTGPWDIYPILTGAPDVKLGITEHLKRKERATAAAGTSLMIPSDAKYKDEAWELIDMLTRNEVEVAVTQKTNMTMPRKSWASSPAIQAISLIKPFADGLKYAVDWGAEIRLTGKSGGIGAKLQTAFESAMVGRLTPEKALIEFAREANRILAEK